MLSDDIFSFANANGTLYAGDNRTHWATMGAYARMNWNYQMCISLRLVGAMTVLLVLLRDIVGDFSLLSLLVMILHVPITSKNWNYHSLS